MTKIQFRDADATTHLVDASVGQSMMDAAVNGDVPGIDAECGGEMACGTCHVYVDAAWVDRVPERSDDELEAIETLVVGDVRPESRLSCQIRVSPGLDGFAVEVPQP